MLPKAFPWTDRQFAAIRRFAGELHILAEKQPLSFCPLLCYRADLETLEVVSLSGHAETDYAPLTLGFARWMADRLPEGEFTWFYLPMEVITMAALAHMDGGRMTLQTYVVLDDDEAARLFAAAEQQNVCFPLSKLFDAMTAFKPLPE